MDLYTLNQEAQKQIAVAHDLKHYTDRATMWEAIAKDPMLFAEEKAFAERMVEDMRLAVSALTKFQLTQATDAVLKIYPQKPKTPATQEEPAP